MSDSQQSDREYLTARGWWKTAESCGDDGDGEMEWLDPAFESIYPLARAVTIQRARDADEERRAFDRYFAGQSAMLSTDNENEVFTPLFSLDEARDRARRMVELRRQEFSRPDPATAFCNHIRALAEKARSAGTILLPSDVLDALNSSGAGKDS